MTPADSPFTHSYSQSFTKAHKFGFFWKFGNFTRSSSVEQQQSLTWDVETEQEQLKSHLCIKYVMKSLIFLLVLQLKGQGGHQCSPVVAGCLRHSATAMMNTAARGGGRFLCLWFLSKTFITGFTHTIGMTVNHIYGSHSSSLGFIWIISFLGNPSL